MGNGSHYLDHACLGKPSARTVAAVKLALDEVASVQSPATEHTIRLFRAVDRAREEAAALIHTDPGNVLLVENTTHGLGLVATSLPLSGGDNILVADLEFLSATVVWRTMAQRRGLEIRRVPTEGGRILPEQFAACADRRTRALVISSVQEVTGFRADLAGFQDLATVLGAYLIVDGIQEVGAVPVDVTQTPVDAYAAGGHKWLRSPFGAGFLYVKPSLLDQLDPPFFGYLALSEPREGWQHYLRSPKRSAFDSLDLLPDARRLWSTGTPNWLGAIGLGQAIRDLRSVGASAIWERISNLRESLLSGLREQGVYVVADDKPGLQEAGANCSGIVCFSLTQGPAAESALLEALTEARIYVSERRTAGLGGIRVSIHYDNSPEDIAALLETVTSCVRKNY
jgi:cysteine desulfurase/selenocysteine lyase